MHDLTGGDWKRVAHAEPRQSPTLPDRDLADQMTSKECFQADKSEASLDHSGKARRVLGWVAARTGALKFLSGGE